MQLDSKEFYNSTTRYGITGIQYALNTSITVRYGTVVYHPVPHITVNYQTNRVKRYDTYRIVCVPVLYIYLIARIATIL